MPYGWRRSQRFISGQGREEACAFALLPALLTTAFGSPLNEHDGLACADGMLTIRVRVTQAKPPKFRTHAEGSCPQNAEMEHAMTRDEIVSFWGRDRLQRWPEEVLWQRMITSKTKSFLKEVGLPVGIDWSFSFELAGKPPLHHLKFFQIGLIRDVPICLNLFDTCSIKYLSADFSCIPNMLVNNSIELFAECLVYYQQFAMAGDLLPIAGRSLPGSDYKKLIDVFEKNIRSADPAALEGADTFWGNILEGQRDS